MNTDERDGLFLGTGANWAYGSQTENSVQTLGICVYPVYPVVFFWEETG